MSTQHRDPSPPLWHGRPIAGRPPARRCLDTHIHCQIRDLLIGEVDERYVHLDLGPRLKRCEATHQRRSVDRLGDAIDINLVRRPRARAVRRPHHRSTSQACRRDRTGKQHDPARPLHRHFFARLRSGHHPKPHRLCLSFRTSQHALSSDEPSHRLLPGSVDPPLTCHGRRHQRWERAIHQHQTVPRNTHASILPTPAARCRSQAACTHVAQVLFQQSFIVFLPS